MKYVVYVHVHVYASFSFGTSYIQCMSACGLLRLCV